MSDMSEYMRLACLARRANLQAQDAHVYNDIASVACMCVGMNACTRELFIAPTLSYNHPTNATYAFSLQTNCASTRLLTSGELKMSIELAPKDPSNIVYVHGHEHL